MSLLNDVKEKYAEMGVYDRRRTHLHILHVRLC
jgi:hypothetical protein